MQSIVVLFALLIANTIADTSRSFTAEIEAIEIDGSISKATWNYDYLQSAERVLYHRDGSPTVNLRLYARRIEFLVIEDECYMFPLDSVMPSPDDRVASFVEFRDVVRVYDTVNGPVDSLLFEIPSACAQASADELGNGTFCPTCLTVGNSVIGLGCNATATEISSVCGDLFATLCKQCLADFCNGACEIETCAADVCCLFDLCEGDTCNSSYSSVDPVQPEGPNYADEVNDGIFCPSCESVGQSVVNLGCNATAAEISNLCGNLFAGVCKTVLETACSGVCQVEQCAADACCAVDLCSGSTCNGTTSAESEPYGVPLLL